MLDENASILILYQLFQEGNRDIPDDSMIVSAIGSLALHPTLVISNLPVTGDQNQDQLSGNQVREHKCNF